ncbi:MAG: MAPEG family protein [Marinosulfonomonas sp.]
MLAITPIYAGLIALLFLAISYRVVLGRRNLRISIGDGDDKDMEKRMRVQANCAEYAPLGIILLAMAEIQGMPGWLVHVSGIALLLGRVLHAIGLGSTPQIPFLRVWGMYLTVGMIFITAIANVTHAIF